MYTERKQQIERTVGFYFVHCIVDFDFFVLIQVTWLLIVTQKGVCCVNLVSVFRLVLERGSRI